MDRAVRFLLVEDNPGDAQLLCATLADTSAGGQDFQPTVVGTLAEAQAALGEQAFDVVMLDLSLPDSTGLETLRRLLASTVCPAVVVMTGHDDESVGTEAVRLGAQDYLVKGRTDRVLLVRAMSYAIQRKDLVTQLQKARDLLEMRVDSRTKELRQAVEVLQEEVSARLEAEQQLRRTNQALAMVTECDKALVRADDELSLLNETCRIIAESGGYRMVFACMALKDATKSLVPVAVAGVDPHVLDNMPLSYDPAAYGRGPTGQAVWLGHAVVCNNITQESWVEAWRSLARKLECNSALALPLQIGGDVFGSLTIYDHRVDAFSEDQVALMTELADDLAFGVSALRTRHKRRQAEQALQHSNALLERVFSNTHIMLAYLDCEFNFVRVNRRYAEHAGKDEEYFTGKKHFALYPNAENQRIFDEAIRTGQIQNVYENPFFYPVPRGSGATWWNWSVVPVHGASGEVEGVVLSLLDVTDHVHSRNALRESERKAHEARLQLGTIVESSEDAIFSVTMDGTITSWNRGAQLIWGYRPADIVGRSITGLMSIHRVGDLQELLRVVFNGKRASSSDMEGIGKNKRKLHVSISISAMRDADNNIIGASLIARDITIRKQMENEVLEIVDAEWQRARYELHEQLAQRLSGSAMLCRVLARDLARANGNMSHLGPKLAESATQIETELRGAIQQTTSLAHGLVPVPPTPHGLMDSLRELCGQMEHVQPTLCCRFFCDRPVSIRNAATANQLYRVAQEAVSNSLGLGHATAIEIGLARQGDMVHLTITDNGSGGDPKVVKKSDGKDAKGKKVKEAGTKRTSSKSHGLGFQVMSYRASSIGGSLTQRRGPKGGNVVRVSAPIQSSRSPRSPRGK